MLPTLGSAFAFRHRVFDTVSLSWSELAPRGWLEVVDAEVLGPAAQLSYYSFLALLPAILFLLALATFFHLANLTDDIGRSLGPFVSGQVLMTSADRRRSGIRSLLRWRNSPNAAGHPLGSGSRVCGGNHAIRGERK